MSEPLAAARAKQTLLHFAFAAANGSDGEEEGLVSTGVQVPKKLNALLPLGTSVF